jgi:hypothetical protein
MKFAIEFAYGRTVLVPAQYGPDIVLALTHSISASESFKNGRYEYANNGPLEIGFKLIPDDAVVEPEKKEEVE